MLSPTIHLLFDKGWISFTDSGDLMISDRLPEQDRKRIGMPEHLSAGVFNKHQLPYLHYHRDNIFVGQI